VSIPSLRLERFSTVHTPSKRARKDVLSTEKIREILHRSRGTDASTRRGARLRSASTMRCTSVFLPPSTANASKAPVRGLIGGSPQRL